VQRVYSDDQGAGVGVSDPFAEGAAIPDTDLEYPGGFPFLVERDEAAEFGRMLENLDQESRSVMLDRLRVGA